MHQHQTRQRVRGVSLFYLFYITLYFVVPATFGCSILSANWNTTSAYAGQEVYAQVYESGCSGYTVCIEIWEDDPIGDDYIATYCHYGKDGWDYFSWTAQWQEDGAGLGDTPEYYFKVYVNNTHVATSSSQLIVYQSTCQLSSAYWNKTQAAEGETVQGTIVSSGCAGKVATVEIYEDDPVGDDLVKRFTVTLRDGSTTFSWTAVWQEDQMGAGGNPEYYFKVTVDGRTIQSQNKVTVTKLEKVVENLVPEFSCSGPDSCNNIPPGSQIRLCVTIPYPSGVKVSLPIEIVLLKDNAPYKTLLKSVISNRTNKCVNLKVEAGRSYQLRVLLLNKEWRSPVYQVRPDTVPPAVQILFDHDKNAWQVICSDKGRGDSHVSLKIWVLGDHEYTRDGTTSFASVYVSPSGWEILALCEDVAGNYSYRYVPTAQKADILTISNYTFQNKQSLKSFFEALFDYASYVQKKKYSIVWYNLADSAYKGLSPSFAIVSLRKRFQSEGLLLLGDVTQLPRAVKYVRYFDLNVVHSDWPLCFNGNEFVCWVARVPFSDPETTSTFLKNTVQRASEVIDNIAILSDSCGGRGCFIRYDATNIVYKTLQNVGLPSNLVFAPPYCKAGVFDTDPLSLTVCKERCVSDPLSIIANNEGVYIAAHGSGFSFSVALDENKTLWCTLLRKGDITVHTPTIVLTEACFNGRTSLENGGFPELFLQHGTLLYVGNVEYGAGYVTPELISEAISVSRHNSIILPEALRRVYNTRLDQIRRRGSWRYSEILIGAMYSLHSYGNPLILIGGRII